MSADIPRAYDRIAFLYDVYDAPLALLGGRSRRRRLLASARGRVLEVGVGTGANLALYPPGVDITGIDLSWKMLERTRARAGRLGLAVHLAQADAEHLPFADERFDTVVGTWVLCAVADPGRALRELRRVLSAGGLLLLIEHVRSRNAIVGALEDVLDPLFARVMGARIDRDVDRPLGASGLRVLERDGLGIWHRIVATRP